MSQTLRPNPGPWGMPVPRRRCRRWPTRTAPGPARQTTPQRTSRAQSLASPRRAQSRGAPAAPPPLAMTRCAPRALSAGPGRRPARCTGALVCILSVYLSIRLHLICLSRAASCALPESIGAQEELRSAVMSTPRPHCNCSKHAWQERGCDAHSGRGALWRRRRCLGWLPAEG
jgi:hypothetical protein